MSTEPNPQERGDWTSASNAAADEQCKARHQMQLGIPDEPSSDADFGNAIHLAMAGGEVKLTVEQESIVESMLEIERKAVVAYFGPEFATAVLKPVCERRYWIKWPDGLQHSGQIDRVHRWKDKALIVELKSLPGDVASSPRNMQLRDQAVLYFTNELLLSEVATVVAQPLVTHTPEVTVYTKADLMRAREALYHRVSASNTPNQPRTPSEVACKFCKAKTKCKEYQQWAGSKLPMERSLVDTPVKAWTPEQRKLFCDNYSVAKKWLEKMWEEMEKGAEAQPDFVPGYQMVAGEGREKINNLQSVFDRASTFGIALATFLEKSTISKKDLGEIVRACTKHKGKKLSETIDTIIGSDFVVSQASKSLKPIKTWKP